MQIDPPPIADVYNGRQAAKIRFIFVINEASNHHFHLYVVSDLELRLILKRTSDLESTKYEAFDSKSDVQFRMNKKI